MIGHVPSLVHIKRMVYARRKILTMEGLQLVI